MGATDMGAKARVEKCPCDRRTALGAFAAMSVGLEN